MAKFVEKSSNVKIKGKYECAATYAPIKVTCPNSCSLKDEGCYAQLSFVGMINRRLEREQEGMSPDQAARLEAKAIRAAFPKGVPQDGPTGGRPLRVHVSGDCRTQRAARTVAAACRDYVERGGGPVWSYTHAWRNVPRSAWEGVSTLASVESTEDAHKARKQGYAPAILVDEHEDHRAYMKDGLRIIPCPAQTFDDKSCVDCRLCFDADRLYKSKGVIAFAAHGTKTKNLRLNVVK